MMHAGRQSGEAALSLIAVNCAIGCCFYARLNPVRDLRSLGHAICTIDQ
jgi:hypothetical protein